MALVPNGVILPDSDRGGSVTPVININCGCGGGGGGGTTDHEQLTNLFGGNSEGHYHLTRLEYEALLEIIEPNPEPEPEWTEFDGGNAGTSEAEYNANSDHWLDGGYSPSNQSGAKDGGGA